MQHYNIGKKIEVNPFEDVKYVSIAQYSGCVDKLRKYLNKKANSVETRKIGGEFVILYNVELLNYTTILRWIAPFRGVFYLEGKSVHFSIENDVMSCW